MVEQLLFVCHICSLRIQGVVEEKGILQAKKQKTATFKSASESSIKPNLDVQAGKQFLDRPETIGIFHYFI
jgi:hypothetical protein